MQVGTFFFIQHFRGSKMPLIKVARATSGQIHR